MKKAYSFAAILLAGSLAAQAQTKKTTKPVSKAVSATKVALSQLDSASYSFGFKVAQGLKSDGVTSLNYALVAKAMEDTFTGKTSLITDEQASEAISGFLQAASSAKFEPTIAAGKKFLEENKNKPNITTLPSGMQYEVLTAGTGEKPKASDEVTVHYKGTLLDGKQFDSSYDRGEPLTLQLDRVIPGWTEGVQLMPVGSKYRFFVPYQLAYGERGAGPDIPPYSTLIFEIELLKIGAPAAEGEAKAAD